jgi:hypothetical protein
MTDKLFVESLWAFLSVDEQGNEGLCGHRVEGLGWVALVGADEARVVLLRPIAKQIARESGSKIKLVRFTTREELEMIDGFDA